VIKFVIVCSITLLDTSGFPKHFGRLNLGGLISTGMLLAPLMIT